MTRDTISRIWKARADLSKAIMNLHAAKIDASPAEIMSLSRVILALTDERKKLSTLLGESDG